MAIQFPTSSSIDDPSSRSDDSTSQDSSTDDGNSNMSEEEDDEYFAFVGKGIDDVMDAFYFTTNRKGIQNMYNIIGCIL